jgi:hypothetical protein
MIQFTLANPLADDPTITVEASTERPRARTVNTAGPLVKF